MNVSFDGLDIHCRISGEDHAGDVVILHGWGATLETMRPLHDLVEHAYRTISLDLPGFGQSSPPPSAWDTTQYAEFVQGFLAHLGVSRPVLIGHSFGGKLSIRLGAAGVAGKLVLVNSTGIVLPRPLGVRAKVAAYKGFKLAVRLCLPDPLRERVEVWAKRRLGSTDYRQASGLLRETLVKTVNEDIRDLLPRIAVPTLLLWGDADRATPVAGAEIMRGLIPDAGLVVLKGAGHFSFLDKPYETRLVLASFLGLGK
jgi:pimeloyl-ACP methyl ester carboxylesterase